MARASIREELERLVLRNSRLKINEVADEQVLNFDLGFDSHALLNLLLDVEDAFDLELPPERVPEFVGISFADLAAKIEKQREEVS